MSSVCPYCRTEISPDHEVFITCEGCGTPHHAECYEENGGCTLFGCKLAPPDDPKVHVSPGDITQSVGFGDVIAPGLYSPPTGFGDVDAQLAIGPFHPSDMPPPPPPPGSELRLGTVEPSQTPASTLLNPPVQAPKARIKFILLGIFLGAFGVHNFYAGYIKRGVWQLCLTLGTVFYASFVVWIWAVVEICTVDRDRNNVSFT